MWPDQQIYYTANCICTDILNTERACSHRLLLRGRGENGVCVGGGGGGGGGLVFNHMKWTVAQEDSTPNKTKQRWYQRLKKNQNALAVKMWRLLIHTGQDNFYIFGTQPAQNNVQMRFCWKCAILLLFLSFFVSFWIVVVVVVVVVAGGWLLGWFFHLFALILRFFFVCLFACLFVCLFTLI